MPCQTQFGGSERSGGGGKDTESAQRFQKVDIQ